MVVEGCLTETVCKDQIHQFIRDLRWLPSLRKVCNQEGFWKFVYGTTEWRSRPGVSRVIGNSFADVYVDLGRNGGGVGSDAGRVRDKRSPASIRCFAISNLKEENDVYTYDHVERRCTYLCLCCFGGECHKPGI
jgi:hypothetical protein